MVNDFYDLKISQNNGDKYSKGSLILSIQQNDSSKLTQRALWVTNHGFGARYIIPIVKFTPLLRTLHPTPKWIIIPVTFMILLYSQAFIIFQASHYFSLQGSHLKRLLMSSLLACIIASRTLKASQLWRSFPKEHNFIHSNPMTLICGAFKFCWATQNNDNSIVLPLRQLLKSYI